MDNEQPDLPNRRELSVSQLRPKPIKDKGRIQKRERKQRKLSLDIRRPNKVKDQVALSPQWHVLSIFPFSIRPDPDPDRRPAWIRASQHPKGFYRDTKEFFREKVNHSSQVRAIP
ncbi:hypothetical protein PVAG01_04723 [Phlyctema vagabunda]|uniref:Uncharacterized protein n=1 Tax=Phlyctema vagabunda TaxID=108571 RepID=A0ABR4PI55_9HELO